MSSRKTPSLSLIATTALTCSMRQLSSAGSAITGRCSKPSPAIWTGKPCGCRSDASGGDALHAASLTGYSIPELAIHELVDLQAATSPEAVRSVSRTLPLPIGNSWRARTDCPAAHRRGVAPELRSRFILTGPSSTSSPCSHAQNGRRLCPLDPIYRPRASTRSSARPMSRLP